VSPSQVKEHLSVLFSRLGFGLLFALEVIFDVLAFTSNPTRILADKTDS
jgi:hypothetical protein